MNHIGRIGPAPSPRPAVTDRQDTPWTPSFDGLPLPLPHPPGRRRPPRGAGPVDAPAPALAAPDGPSRPSDRIVVIGGSADTLTLLRLAAVRSDEVLLVAEGTDAATRRFVDTFAVERRDAAATDDDLAGAAAVLVAMGDVRRENAVLRGAHRRGIPVHVAGRPLVSDFTLLDMVERRPASFAR